ncbi:LytR/AlgR family response regulator transcription factor [Enterococcus sp. AZ196]|uniref:LytR/AlgR family response regulator transcription factor n=1 Tax=Enterococcus sp. AZ196 TaxID=2774659 RepID=UPI003D2E0F39
MISIYICEDDQTQLEKMTRFIKRYIMIENLDMSIALATEDPHKLLKTISGNTQKNVYFLDIDLNCPEYNGLQLAQEIRKSDPDGYLIFVTTHAELTHLTFQFKVNALDFIIKDGTDGLQKRVGECLSVIVTRMNQTARQSEQALFSFLIGDKTNFLPIESILFFETSNKHKIVVYTMEERLEFVGSLNEIAQKLGKDFFRSHRSTLVHLKKIKQVDAKNGILILENQQTCYLAVRKASKLKQLINLNN